MVGARDAWAASLAAESPFSTDEKLTPLAGATSYNNFHEFGTGKEDSTAYAGALTTKPWSITIDGMMAKPQTIALEDLVRPETLEERIYRMRCVEDWSMMIPWIGFRLADLLKRVEPLGSAKFVAFETLVRPRRCPASAASSWCCMAHVEGLRLDVAMHPLAILAVGLYGEVLPNQNGAPVRLVVPWKYDFKGIKLIVRIRLVEAQPPTSWNRQNPNEYGFYSNVNPEVDHPRWSQAIERRIGEGGLFAKRRPTLMFNGCADQVADLYAGMDLRTYF